MKLPLMKAVAAMVLVAASSVAVAADEMVLNAFEDGMPASGLEAVLDGEVTEFLNDRGSATFDLDAGPHTLELLLAGIEMHQFSFTVAAGQLVDITVSLSATGAPEHFVESYFPTETARDRAAAPKGNLTGIVRNNGSALAGASVAVSKVGTTLTTGDDGRFAGELPRGVYTLTITHPEMDSAQTEEVRVVSGITKGLRLAYGGLGDAAGDAEEVVVTGTFDPTAFGESEQFSVNIIETLGIEDIARFGDSDVAGSVVRVPSVTVQSGKFVFIRGLGGRYITTTLNGATLPSTNPTRREVPLDLFPSNIVKQLDVKKSFVASMPGESTGGNLVINTRTFPEESAGKVSFSLGYTDGLTGDDVAFDSVSGDYDFFGLDDGSRDEPGGVVAIADLLACSECRDSLSAGQEQNLRRVGAILLRDGLDLGSQSAAPDMSLGLNYGDVFDVAGNEFGYFVAGNFKNGWSQREEGISRSYNPLGNGGIELFNDFTFSEATNQVEASGLVSLGLNVGNSSFQSTSIISRTTESKTRVTRGQDGDSGAQTFRYSIDWAERQFLSQQIAGEHVLGLGGGLIANWQISGSHARRYAPDRREVRFDLEGNDGIFNLQLGNLIRRFDDLSDSNFDASGALEYLFDNSIGEASADVGVQFITRERDSDSRTFNFNGNEGTFEDNAPNLRASDVINLGNITGDASTGLAFNEATLPSDSYSATLDLNSVYASFSQRFLDNFQAIVGLRYEDFFQDVDTFSIETGLPDNTAPLDEGIALPALSLNWEINSSQQLRFAASKTVSRPDFRERSNATFYDQEFDFRVRGNPNLVISEVINLDLRWELYFSDTESISVALFQKTIDDPIERVLLLASGTAGDSRTFRNGDEADVVGIEFDGRRDFDLNSTGSRSLFITLNSSFIDSEIDVDNQTRKLQGQPDYTFNMVLGYDDFAGGIRHELTALFNQAGETIVDVGQSGLPDVIEQPRLSVDLNYKAFLTDSLVFKAKVGNLLDETVEFTQGGQVLQEYKRGVTLQAGIDWSF